MPADTNAAYGRQEYWEDRFSREEAGFEWLGPYSSWRDRILRIINQHAASRNNDDDTHATNRDNCDNNNNDVKVLVLGGGTSLLAEELAADLLKMTATTATDHPSVTCMDYSPAAVATMQRRTDGDAVSSEVAARLRYDCADLFSLVSDERGNDDDADDGKNNDDLRKSDDESVKNTIDDDDVSTTGFTRYAPGTFDVVIEKGVLDVLAAGVKHDPWHPPPELIRLFVDAVAQTHAVLKRDGIFLSISFDQPHFRLPLLCGGGLPQERQQQPPNPQHQQQKQFHQQHPQRRKQRPGQQRPSSPPFSAFLDRSPNASPADAIEYHLYVLAKDTSSLSEDPHLVGPWTPPANCPPTERRSPVQYDGVSDDDDEDFLLRLRLNDDE